MSICENLCANEFSNNKKQALLLMEAFFMQYSKTDVHAIISSWYNLKLEGQISELPTLELESFKYFFRQVDKLTLAAILLNDELKSTL